MEVSFLGDEDGYSSLIGVYGCLASCCILHLLGLSTKCPIRGGVDVGLGLNISECGDVEVYGPALGTAYNLESKLADYPRILASDGLIKYLEIGARLQQTGLIARLIASLALECKRFITIDTDGKPMLDFLGEKMATLSTAEERRRQFAGISECIAEQQQMAQAENDPKLLMRYQRLAAYVEKCSVLWK